VQVSVLTILRHLAACACFVSLFAPSPASRLTSCHGLLWTNPTPGQPISDPTQLHQVEVLGISTVFPNLNFPDRFPFSLIGQISPSTKLRTVALWSNVLRYPGSTRPRSRRPSFRTPATWRSYLSRSICPFHFPQFLLGNQRSGVPEFPLRPVRIDQTHGQLERRMP